MIIKPRFYNPWRYDCEKQGDCWGAMHRPRLDHFNNALGDDNWCAFSDVDGFAEINGEVLFLEFKEEQSGGRRIIPQGQRIAFEMMSGLSNHIKVVVVCVDDMPKMNVRHVRVIQHGKTEPWQESTKEELYARIQSWSARARAKKRI